MYVPVLEKKQVVNTTAREQCNMYSQSVPMVLSLAHMFVPSPECYHFVLHLLCSCVRFDCSQSYPIASSS